MDISLGGLIIFRMLGVYVDSSGTLIPALRVLLDISVVKCTLVIHSGTSGRVILYEDFRSGRVIPLFEGRCSADNSSPLIVIVAGALVNPNGMTRSSNCTYQVQDAVLYSSPSSLRSVGEDISSSSWLYCELGSPHTAPVRRPSSQMRSVLPQAVSILPSSWSHLLILRFRRSTQFLWFFTAGLPCDFLARSSYAPRARSALPHKFPLDAMKGAVRELPNLCCIRPHSPCISRGYDLHHQQVHNLSPHQCISLYLRLWIWDDDGEWKPGTCGSSGSPRNEPNPASPTTSHCDSASR